MSNEMDKKQREHLDNNAQRVADYLKKNKREGLTTVEAVVKLGITNLPRRVLDLKELGYEIIPIREQDEKKHWNRYFLIKSPKG